MLQQHGHIKVKVKSKNKVRNINIYTNTTVNNSDSNKNKKLKNTTEIQERNKMAQNRHSDMFEVMNSKITNKYTRWFFTRILK